MAPYLKTEDDTYTAQQESAGKLLAGVRRSLVNLKPAMREAAEAVTDNGYCGDCAETDIEDKLSDLIGVLDDMILSVGLYGARA